MPKTRKDICCPVFGEPQKLKGNMLPTYYDIIKYYLWVRNDLLCINNGKDPSIKEVCEIISVDVKKLWEKASIPIVTHQQVVSRLILYYNKYKSMKKLRDETKKKEFYNEALKKLFDIAICKCTLRKLCKCQPKIPIIEQDFLKDQREERKMYIGPVDRTTTISITRKNLRKQKYEEFLKFGTPSTSTSATTVQCFSDVASFSSGSSDSEVKKDTKHHKKQPTKQMRLKLQNLAASCDRTGVSDRSAAIIVNAALLDLNIINSDDPSKVIDRSKLRRERQKVRQDLQFEAGKTTISSLYFDGRKDKTFTLAKIENNYHRKTVTEEHISLISEPGSEYIGHLSINSGKAITIQKSMVQFLSEKIEYQSSLVAVGCDGTAVNTGHKSGVIVLLEKHLNRPLQWFVCLLHANELPLRHLFATIDGTTTGPNSYSGNIGKMLVKCLDLKVVAFQTIDTDLPDVNTELLSSDQKYLYEMCSAISRRSIPPDLANKDPGKLAHSRWLTCANRILRLYVGTKKSSENLRELAIFIMKVYAPTWFDIKMKPSCKHGPIHVFNMIKRSLYLREELKDIVLKTIQRNAFFVHPENLLLAMLQDEHPHIKELAPKIPIF